MRIKFYFIFSFLFLLIFSACSKGDVVKEPQFGMVTIKNLAPGNISAVQGENQTIPLNGFSFNVLAGKSRFRFYESNALLLDTTLLIEPYLPNPYVLFRPALNFGLKIYDPGFHGLDKELLPDSGVVKMSFANFSSSLPGKVNIYLTAMNYTSNVPKEIQVGEFLNVNSSFSAFSKVTLAINQASQPQDIFSVLVKDPVDGKLLATTSFTLPTNVDTRLLQNSIYLLYLNPGNAVATLMSR